MNTTKRNGDRQPLSREQEERITLSVARVVWEQGITIEQLYRVLGIDLEDVGHSDPDDAVSKLAGILTGWHNPPPLDEQSR